MKAPAVTVLLPVLDGMPHLPNAVASVVAQDLTDWELLVVDGGSKDGSREWVIDTARDDGRIRVLDSGPGLVTALNLGVAESRGRYIARMDADDRSRPDRLRLQVAYLDSNPDVDLVCSAAEVRSATRSRHVWRPPEHPVALDWSLFFGNWIHHSTVMLRRNALGATPYREEAKHAEDYDLWIRLAARGRLAGLSAILVDRLQRAAGVSAQNTREQQAVTMRLAAQRIASVLGHAGPEPGLQAIRDTMSGKPLSALDADEAAALLGRLRSRFTQIHDPDRRARAALRHDLADRYGLLAVATRRAAPGTAVRLGMKALGLAPARVLRRGIEVVAGRSPLPPGQ